MAMIHISRTRNSINIRFQPPFLWKKPPARLVCCDDGGRFSANILYEYPLVPMSSMVAVLPLLGDAINVWEEPFEENMEFRLGRPWKFPPFSMMTESRIPAGVEIRFGGDMLGGSLDHPRVRKAMVEFVVGSG